MCSESFTRIYKSKYYLVAGLAVLIGCVCIPTGIKVGGVTLIQDDGGTLGSLTADHIYKQNIIILALQNYNYYLNQVRHKTNHSFENEITISASQCLNH